MRGKNALFSVAVVLLVLGSPVFAYRQVIDLGVIPDYGVTSYALSINDNSQIVGYSYHINGTTHACLFDQTGQGATSLWGNSSEAYSINNAGQIVGRSLFMSFPPPFNSSNHACLFDSKNMMNSKDLGSLGGSTSLARSINDSGLIVGGAYNSSGRYRACLFDSTGGGANKDLGTLGGNDSTAYSVNDSGQIIGGANNSSGKSRACLFDSTGNGANIDLGTLGGTNSSAFSINNNNQIVGRASNGSTTHACLFDWTGEGANIDLGTLGEPSYSEAWSINDIGQIVGWSYDSSSNRHACLFDSTGQGNNIDLNTLIDPASSWVLMEAYSINNSGWIVGNGINADGVRHGFLLTPEPATLLLFGIGITLLRRKK